MAAISFLPPCSVTNRIVERNGPDALDVGGSARVAATQDQLARLEIPDPGLDRDAVSGDLGARVDQHFGSGAEPVVGGLGARRVAIPGGVMGGIRYGEDARVVEVRPKGRGEGIGDLRLEGRGARRVERRHGDRELPAGRSANHDLDVLGGSRCGLRRRGLGRQARGA
jgi:hypothetical protein